MHKLLHCRGWWWKYFSLQHYVFCLLLHCKPFDITKCNWNISEKILSVFWNNCTFYIGRAGDQNIYPCNTMSFACSCFVNIFIFLRCDWNISEQNSEKYAKRIAQIATLQGLVIKIFFLATPCRLPALALQNFNISNMLLKHLKKSKISLKCFFLQNNVKH